jgi:plastocyanin
VVAVLALLALGMPTSASADKPAQVPVNDPGQVPMDDITGQDHPADVTVQMWNYIPDTVRVKQGGKIKFWNYDLWPYGAGVSAHSLTHYVGGCTAPPYKDCGGTGYPLFSSALTDHGYVHNVEGVDKLKPGTYPFGCQMHSFMQGTLIVE